MSDVFYPHAIVFPTGNAITQMEEIPIQPNFQEITEYAASGVLPAFTGNHSQDPMTDLETSQIKNVLDRCTIDGIAGAFDGSNVDFEWQRASSLTGRVEIDPLNLTHVRARATASYIAWQSIQASENEIAKITFRFQPVSNGGNPPLAISTAVAIAAAANVEHYYTLGPINAVTSTSLNKTLCVQNWSWDNNNLFKNVFCSGGTSLEYSALDRSAPVITVDVEDIRDPLGLFPSGESITSLEVYLRKKLQGGSNVPDATAEHIKFTMAVGTARPMGTRQLGFAVHNFTVNTASAIT